MNLIQLFGITFCLPVDVVVVVVLLLGFCWCSFFVVVAVVVFDKHSRRSWQKR